MDKIRPDGIMEEYFFEKMQELFPGWKVRINPAHYIIPKGKVFIMVKNPEEVYDYTRIREIVMREFGNGIVTESEQVLIGGPGNFFHLYLNEIGCCWYTINR